MAVAFRRTTRTDVLELRVHGVNNTTPADLLDLPADAVRLVAGDKLGSFWAPVADTVPGAGERGHVPAGIRREAYSWGGMVRTTPNFGGVGAAGVVAGVVARILYALILPFSVGNAVEWTRHLDGRAAAVTAGLGRLFGLVLTLLFTMAAVTLSLDLLAAQCAEQAALCTPIQGLLDPFADWTTAQRLALFAVGPIVAVGVLWFVSAFSRQRYDVLPGMEGGIDTLEGGERRRALPTAALAQPTFWTNRITAALARAHMACAVALTTGLVAQHVWVHSGAVAAMVLAIAAAVVLAAGAVLIVVLPTMALPVPGVRTARWPAFASGVLLGVAAAVFVALVVVLVRFTPRDALEGAAPGLYGSGFVPLVLLGLGAVLTLSGLAWRPWRGRRATAWSGCAPAVFMLVSLVVATGLSAVAVVAVGDVLNGAPAASDLIRDHGATATALQLPSVWVGMGATILSAVVLGVLVVLTALLVPRRLAVRASIWGQPAVRGDEVIPLDAGVLPLSQEALFDRIAARRRFAARLHLAEPAVGILAVLMAAAVALGWVWTGVAYLGDLSLWAALPLPVAAADVRLALDVSMWGLAAVGLLMVAVLASGASDAAPRPLGIVWDIACFLPRTGQPFGPPCFAERAVPEIAGRVYAWLRESHRRTVVLSAHSMGAPLVVAALGLLASSPDTRVVLPRVRLLTYGVQLRAYFGRMLPELFGPEVLGTRPSRAPGFYRRDPWTRDAVAQRSTPGAPVSRLGGTVLADLSVRWVNLWRLTDYLGFPAVSTARGSADGSFVNGVDRYAQELDTTGYMVAVGTHSEYFRAPAYDEALRDLAR